MLLICIKVQLITKLSSTRSWWNLVEKCIGIQTISRFGFCIENRSNRGCQAVKYTSNSMCWFTSQKSFVGWKSLALTLSIVVVWIQIGLNKTYSVFILSLYENHCNEGIHCWNSMWLTLIWLCRSAEAFIYSNTGCCCIPPLVLCTFIFNFSAQEISRN